MDNIIALLVSHISVAYLFYAPGILLILGSLSLLWRVRKQYSLLVKLQNNGIETEGKISGIWVSGSKKENKTVAYEFRSQTGTSLAGQETIPLISWLKSRETDGDLITILHSETDIKINAIKTHLSNRIHAAKEQSIMMVILILLEILALFLGGYGICHNYQYYCVLTSRFL
jgi:hypothetical protein